MAAIEDQQYALAQAREWTDDPLTLATMAQHPHLWSSWEITLRDHPRTANVKTIDTWLREHAGFYPNSEFATTYNQFRNNSRLAGDAIKEIERTVTQETQAAQETPRRWAEGFGWFHDNEDGWLWREEDKSWYYDNGDGNLWNQSTGEWELAPTPDGQSPTQIATEPMVSETLPWEQVLGEEAMRRGQDWLDRGNEFEDRARDIQDRYRPMVDAARDDLSSVFDGRMLDDEQRDWGEYGDALRGGLDDQLAGRGSAIDQLESERRAALFGTEATPGEETGWMQHPELGYVQDAGGGWFYSSAQDRHLWHAGGPWMQDEDGNYIQLQSDFDPQPFLAGATEGTPGYQGEREQAISDQIEELYAVRDQYGAEMRPAIDQQIAELTQALEGLRGRRLESLQDVLHGGPLLPEGWLYHPTLGYLQDAGDGWFQTQDGDWLREDPSGWVWNQTTGEWQEPPEGGIAALAQAGGFQEGLYGNLEGTAAARRGQAESLGAALNLMAQEERDRVEANLARQGFLGGSSAADASMSRALLQGRQGAAQAMTQAELDNAMALQGVQDWAAMQRYGAGNEFAEGMFGVDQFGADERRNLSKELARMGVNIGTESADEQRALADEMAGRGLDLSEDVAERRFRDVGMFGADERRSLSDLDATGTIGLRDQDRARRLNMGSAPFDFYGRESAVEFAPDNFRDYGYWQAVNLTEPHRAQGSSMPYTNPFQARMEFAPTPSYGEIGPGLFDFGASMALDAWKNRKQPDSTQPKP
jgi:hypothetical protein